MPNQWNHESQPYACVLDYGFNKYYILNWPSNKSVEYSDKRITRIWIQQK